MSDRSSSVFLAVPTGEWLASNALAFAIRDRYPVTAGHTLVITRRVVPTWFDATREEQSALLELVDEVRRQLDREFSPAGYNVGFNAGTAAGQTVPHLHVHVIPRYEGDVDDPRGGVRYVVPERGNYQRVAADWSRPPGPAVKAQRTDPLTTGDPGRHLRRHVGELFGRAADVVLVSAFIQASGLELLLPAFQALLQRGGRLRVVTGDYLHITQADALQQLLDLEVWANAYSGAEDESRLAGRFGLRVVRTEEIGRAFHPKAWLFRWGADPEDGVAYVGSSNLSRSALEHGVEWNLRVERRRDTAGWEHVAEAAETLWSRARPIDSDWLDAYRKNARSAAKPLPLGDVEAEHLPPPEPRDVQVDALDALNRSRASGEKRALVVLATGLGKTFLAAFDVRAFSEGMSGRPRVLFLAHRRELLVQASQTFRRVLPEARFGWCVGSANELDGEVVFASVQKLSRPQMLGQMRPDDFDYVVIDEVHHATAVSYRRILSVLEPKFLLGLTATPDRADEADVVGLFDDHLPYRADLAVGVSRGLLVPFAYRGLRDTVDYAPIPWRNGRFDPSVLTSAVVTQERMRTLWSSWQETPGSRTLVFCASIIHAEFVRDWLRGQGVRIEAVHSKAGSFDRTEGLQMLESGELDALCTVDLFNEGIDCRPIDRVVMLRPTESPVIFLQQLGRGLRTVEGKSALQVIDFVGNHRVFLDRLRTLLSLGGGRTAVRAFLDGAEPSLPAGCTLEVELEAIELLRKLLPRSSRNELVRVYRELRVARDVRPTAGELHRMGLNPASVRSGHGSWFGFVGDEGDLSEAERQALGQGEQWLREVETTAMNKCFKMVVLEVLVEDGALHRGMELAELARRCRLYLARSPELLADLRGVENFDDPEATPGPRWLAYWRRNPVAAWTKGRWFELRDEWFVSRVPVPVEDAASDALLAMTAELVDWRLASYRKRRADAGRATAEGLLSSFRIKVLQNASGDPILHFGSRKGREAMPSGETDVRLPDGSVWRFRFRKIACNVARPVGTQKNQLADLLRRWFGPAAGRAGTDFQVEFRRSPDGLWVAPVESNVLQFPTRHRVTAYPTLRAAAGAVASDATLQGDGVEGLEAALPVRRPAEGLFAVRATGRSMDGGKRPIRDGDWVLLRWGRALGLDAVTGRVALVAVGDANSDRQFLLKRVVRTEAGVVLRSDNPEFDDLVATGAMQVVAVFHDVVAPEDLAPEVGRTLSTGDVAAAFRISETPTAPWARVDGHLFVVVDGHGALLAPDRVRALGVERRPGETAYVLTQADGAWRYAGVGRWVEAEDLWGIPAVDFGTWRALGRGRSASR
jgi:superfamily II DNA or RNA helicase/diadenosine tetraphosphate (Ap4A) HIT family hydrolase/SOS-response transcriptional repressor LexA